MDKLAARALSTGSLPRRPWPSMEERAMPSARACAESCRRGVHVQKAESKRHVAREGESSGNNGEAGLRISPAWVYVYDGAEVERMKQNASFPTLPPPDQLGSYPDRGAYTPRKRVQSWGLHAA